MNYAYNLMDENLRRFNAAGADVSRSGTTTRSPTTGTGSSARTRTALPEEGSVALLAARAMRAFHDYMPTRLHPLEQDRLYTSFGYGPSLEVFRIDLRSYRGPNGDGMQTELSPEARIIGERQLPG